MKKALIILALAVLYANPSMAQSDSIKTSRGELLFLTKEFGFSTQIILKGIFHSDNVPVDIMFKKLKNGKWIRYGVSLQAYRKTDFDFPDSRYRFSENSIDFTPSVGIEKRKKLSPRWNILYGTDARLITMYRMNDRKWSENGTDNFESISKEAYYTLGAGVSPFIGLTFNISPRLSISTEASASLHTTFGKRYTERYNTDQEPFEEESEFWMGGVSINPASAIFAYYRF